MSLTCVGSLVQQAICHATSPTDNRPIMVLLSPREDRAASSALPSETPLPVTKFIEMLSPLPCYMPITYLLNRKRAGFCRRTRWWTCRLGWMRTPPTSELDSPRPPSLHLFVHRSSR